MRRWLVPLLALLWSPALAVDLQVSSNGWHTGLVIARADIPSGMLPELEAFGPEVKWFEIGWGSAEYYPVRDPGVLDTLRAISGSAAVLHVAGLDIPAADRFPSMELAPLSLTATQFVRLISRLDATMDRKGGGLAVSRAGLYDFSLFFPAKGRFTLGHTCNAWTAEVLAEAGAPVSADGVQRAEELMRQIR
ncbi:hypothetical protein A6A04_03625 [Paramagnetospirillum marisnigri]|uniref:DUF2459 domain-containing protein n=1 Tax=Paramagnetospirillum marisnigri TaxID=1285242 RepID=A0A178MMQ1_9PROT|nr:DUF2459 domain-containing protein [Paramagnetospirillum marisnigri]OAN49214.1 hypothetical protein A6A04_03625 [Paramagnetospirillum marisnigri]